MKINNFEYENSNYYERKSTKKLSQNKSVQVKQIHRSLHNPLFNLTSNME